MKINSNDYRVKPDKKLKLAYGVWHQNLLSLSLTAIRFPHSPIRRPVPVSRRPASRHSSVVFWRFHIEYRRLGKIVDEVPVRATSCRLFRSYLKGLMVVSWPCT